MSRAESLHRALSASPTDQCHHRDLLRRVALRPRKPFGLRGRFGDDPRQVAGAAEVVENGDVVESSFRGEVVQRLQRDARVPDLWPCDMTITTVYGRTRTARS